MAFQYEKFVNGCARPLRGMWTPAVPSEIHLEFWYCPADPPSLAGPVDVGTSLCWLAGG